MVVFTTIVGFVLQAHPERQQNVFEGLKSSLPIVAAYVKVASLSASGVSLLLGCCRSAARCKVVFGPQDAAEIAGPRARELGLYEPRHPTAYGRS
jgi:hypothetical protein